MKKEVNGYYRRNGVFVKGHFKTGKPDLLPPEVLSHVTHNP